MTWLPVFWRLRRWFNHLWFNERRIASFYTLNGWMVLATRRRFFESRAAFRERHNRRIDVRIFDRGQA